MIFYLGHFEYFKIQKSKVENQKSKLQQNKY